MHPSVKRLGYFIPEKKRIMCKEGETISEEEIERQIQGTEYMKWMAKNQEEHEIVEAMQDEIDNNLTPVVTMNNINAELGYNMFCVQRENGQDVVKRMKDTMMGNNDDDLPFAFELTYENFAKRYRYDNSKDNKRWKRRRMNVADVVVRLYMGYPGTEYFYLRKLLRTRTHILHVSDLKRHPETGEEFVDYRDTCIALGLVNSSKEYFHCVHEAQQMGFSGWKLLGMFAQMIIATDVNNIGEIWNGPEEGKQHDEVEQLYPKGYKHLMMQYPDHIRKMAGFKYDYWELPNETLREECEQYTLRKLNYMLERSGTDYPIELPTLDSETCKKRRTKEWLAAHNFDSKKAQHIYKSHKTSMEGQNQGGFRNQQQLDILARLETEIRDYHDNPEEYGGFVAMLDAPGGTGKTFLIETLAAYCALPENNFLCLCAAFSGVAAQLLPNGVTIHRRFGMVPGMDPEQLCNIERGSTKSQLLLEAKLLVMDEVTMMSKVDLERIDRTLRFLTGKKDTPFGGNIFIL